MFEELFTEFNGRYDKLNDPLNRIIDGNQDEELTQDEKIVLSEFYSQLLRIELRIEFK